jgi:AcrR family transcriptional regulator
MGVMLFLSIFLLYLLIKLGIMEFQVTFKVNEKLYVKNPETSEIGRNIVKTGVDMICKLGFESFTFKKLAEEMETTEATIYRYFENKHRLLLYILNWYWSYLEFLVVFNLHNVNDSQVQIRTIIRLLTHELPETSGRLEYNRKNLNRIVIAESSKAYLVKDVSEINRDQAFKPYKDLCAKIADVIREHCPTYKYPRSLASTLVETAHSQQFFSTHLPRLSDSNQKEHSEYVSKFLEDLVFKTLSK